MTEIRQTRAFEQWRAGLRDTLVRKRIGARIDRLSFGNFGDAKPVGDGVRELRLDFGPGYRIYFVQRGKLIVVLLCGGDKGTQTRDIVRAKEMVRQIDGEFDDA